MSSRKIRCRWAFCLCAIFLVACFGIDRRGGIVHYAGGEATTGEGRFRTGPLPPSWKGPSLRLKQLVFEDNGIGATIVTDALCGPKFNDAPLPRLARDLFERLDQKKLGAEKWLTLDGRQAVRLEGEGSLDGVPIRMEVVVSKKNFCLYDFVYFAPPDTFQKGWQDFEGYLNGFRVR